MMQRSAILVAGIALFAVALHTQAEAEEASAHPYSGDFFTRSTLTGDWGGVRNDLAAKGITFDASVTQISQSVVGGGKDSTWEYGGRGDLLGNLDTGKLGLWPGGFLTAELEGNWSKSVNGNTGALSPVNNNQLFPVPPGNNVALPNLTFAQFLSPYAGGVVGKFDTMLTGDENEFAHGKGDTQFLNLAFNINPVAIVVPYSTLGAGAIVLPTKDPHEAILNFLVLSATGKASTAGFDDFSGAIFAGGGRIRTDFFDLTGHQLVGALYSNKRYTSLDQRLGFVINNQALATQDGTWAVYYNFDQFLYETDKNAGHGVGLFGRFGASEGDPIPVKYFFSAGVGGKGLISGRPLDQFGIGYYYSDVANPTFQHVLVTREFLRSEWGFEAYYNLALTPWLLLSPDLQVIGPAQKQQIVGGGLIGPERVLGPFIGPATVLGFRLQVIL
jgi:porin